MIGAGAMKRWPRVTLPERMPSISKSTTSVSSVSGPKRQRTEWSGRTQARLPGFVEAAPQRIDFGHGKERMTFGTISAMTSPAMRPGLSITAT